MPRVTVNLDSKSYRILSLVKERIIESTGERLSIPELVELHFAALFAGDELEALI